MRRWRSTKKRCLTALEETEGALISFQPQTSGRAEEPVQGGARSEQAASWRARALKPG